MKKLSKEKSKGITLIALVITIIVLLILAGVSVATLTGDNGLLNRTNESAKASEIGEIVETAKTDVTEKQMSNQGEITEDQLEEIVEKYGNLSVENGEKKITTEKGYEIKVSDIYNGKIKEFLKPGETETSTSKNNYKDEEGKKATIPGGFKVSDVDGEKNIDTGLVVINPEDNGEFVWVPVDNPNEMYGTLADGTKAGKIYASWTATTSIPLNWKETEGVMSITSVTSIREPDVVTDYDNNTEYLNLMNGILGTAFTNSGDFKSYLQSEYEKAIESVIRYKGFYVGRYETSLEGNKPKSVKGATSANAKDNSQMWYGLYAKQQLYSTSSVKGQMIWGSQYDAMMKWMQKNNIDVSSTMPIDGTSRNTGSTTGTMESDKLNNIYDLLGNRREWTSETNFTYHRVLRGGYYNNSSYLSSRHSDNTDSVNLSYGSREALYIL